MEKVTFMIIMTVYASAVLSGIILFSSREIPALCRFIVRIIRRWVKACIDVGEDFAKWLDGVP